MPAPKKHVPYAGCETGGRPQKYTKEFIEAEAIAFEEWMKQSENVYFKRFAINRGYHPQRLSEFAQNEKFSEVYERAKAWQEVRLVEGGLTNEFNGSFCKFVMGNVCGWVDKVENKLSGDAVNPLQFLLQNIDGKTKGLVADESNES